jgi:hypothetical protein
MQSQPAENPWNTPSVLKRGANISLTLPSSRHFTPAPDTHEDLSLFFPDRPTDHHRTPSLIEALVRERRALSSAHLAGLSLSFLRSFGDLVGDEELLGKQRSARELARVGRLVEAGRGGAVARLQRQFAENCLPVEREHQAQFVELVAAIARAGAGGREAGVEDWGWLASRGWEAALLAAEDADARRIAGEVARARRFHEILVALRAS